MKLTRGFDKLKMFFAASAPYPTAGRRAFLFAALCALVILDSGCGGGGARTEENLSVNQPTAGGTAPTGNLTPVPANILNSPIQTTDGRTIRLADFAGKVVVLDLWATWCPPCREEIPHLVEIKRQYADRGLEVIGLSTGNPPDTLEMLNRFSQQFNINYPVGLPENVIGPAMLRERGGAIPQTYIITRDGRILIRFVGFNPSRSAPQLRAAVERAVNTQ